MALGGDFEALEDSIIRCNPLSSIDSIINESLA